MKLIFILPSHLLISKSAFKVSDERKKIAKPSVRTRVVYKSAGPKPYSNPSLPPSPNAGRDSSSLFEQCRIECRTETVSVFGGSDDDVVSETWGGRFRERPTDPTCFGTSSREIQNERFNLSTIQATVRRRLLFRWFVVPGNTVVTPISTFESTAK